jgi:hypothetical protein
MSRLAKEGKPAGLPYRRRDLPALLLVNSLEAITSRWREAPGGLLA